MSKQEEFDYVIVGGGAAGCVLANRLSEDASVRVLLLEAGGRDLSPLISTPGAVAMVWSNPRFNWGYRSEPEPYADNRQLFLPRGKVLGGSSSINMMSYVRGHRQDFDRWATMGATGWSFQDILPYFMRAETYDQGGEGRGSSGPLQVTRSNSPDEIYDAFMAAGAELGYPYTEDYNGASQDGFARMQLMTQGGRRSSSARAYLRPAERRSNLTVRTKSAAQRLIIEQGRVRGVAYLRNGMAETVMAAREVVLSAGAYGSPQLLMLSGVGPADHLRSVGIAPVLDSPNVGENLRDHPQVNTTFARRGTSRIRKELRLDRLAISALQNQILGTGFASEAPGGVTAFVRSVDGLEVPDLELFCIPSSLAARPWFPGLIAPVEDQIILKPALLRPESVGRVWLASQNPQDAPRILSNFLKDETDRVALREGVRICRALAASEAFRPFIDRELGPSPDMQSDEEIDAYVRATVEPIFHPCGTCRMGEDDAAVLDPQLRFRGLEGLRVVDASVMPDHIGSTINAAVVAIAERASDLIRGR